MLAATAGALAAGAVVFVGGDSGDGQPERSDSGDPRPGSVSGESSSSAYQCPTSMKVLEDALPGRGIPGCEITFSATLPPGWDQGPIRMIVYPGGLGFASDVRYASFPLRDARAYTGKWPLYRMPPRGLSIGIFPQEPVSKAEVSEASPVSLGPSDFHKLGDGRGDPGTTIDLFRGGRRYEVQLRVESAAVSADLVDEANSLLNSIELTERLCPCEGATGAINPSR